MAMGSPPGLSSSSYMGLDNETEALMAAARALLKGVTLRCGITNIRSDCPPPDLRDANSTCASAGSGFAGLDPLDTDTLDQVSNTPWGGYYGPLPQKSVQGVTAFVLQVCVCVCACVSQLSPISTPSPAPVLSSRCKASLRRNARAPFSRSA